MGFSFNPFTGTLDKSGGSSGTTNIFNDIQVDQSGGTTDSYGVLAGTVNGSNTVFTVSALAYVSGTLTVYLNGQLLTQGTNEDWVETTPASGTFTFNSAPQTGDLITVMYANSDTSDTTFVEVAGDTMTGTLTLTDGTTTVAPLKMQDGDLLTTPETGALEYANNTLYFTPATDLRSINLANGVITSDSTVSNTTTETTIYTEPISANELHVGQVVKTRLLGRYSTANANDTFQARLKVGGTTIDTLTSTAANVTDGGIDIEFVFTVRSVGATGTVKAHTTAKFNDESKTDANNSPVTIDTTAADDITLTIQWGAANVNNSVTISQGFCEFIN